MIPHLRLKPGKEKEVPFEWLGCLAISFLGRKAQPGPRGPPRCEMDGARVQAVWGSWDLEGRRRAENTRGGWGSLPSVPDRFQKGTLATAT